jgi:hypothetical protein
MKVKNHLNRDIFPKKYKEFSMPTETVPDQTMSMREILDRHARGLPVPTNIPLFEQEADIDHIMPDVRTLDLSERQAFAEQAKQELNQIKEKLNKKAKKPVTEVTGEAVTDVTEGKRSAADTH